MKTVDTVDLLWTGGWDSTYRMLELVLLRCVHVDPWYVNDGGRPSTPAEMDAMNAIADLLHRRTAEAADRLHPLHVVSLADLEPYEHFAAKCGRLHLGSQYGWLAQLVAQFSLERIEMSIDHGPHRLYELLWSNSDPNVTETGTVYRLRNDVSNPDLELFRAFDFPVLHLTKEEMGARAIDAGFYDILCRTWFCHEPRGGKPCGVCSTCMAAMKAGAAWRIPPLRRIRPRIRFLKKAILDSLESSGLIGPPPKK